MDFDYVPAEAGRMQDDHALVRRASLDEIKTMLTYCVRGEVRSMVSLIGDGSVMSVSRSQRSIGMDGTAHWAR